jgi:hypothetical protein
MAERYALTKRRSQATEPVEAPSCTSPTYVEVQREWTNPQAGTQSDLSVMHQTTVGNGTGSGPFALQRWQNECMREQPYHIILAVPRDGPSQG